MTTGLKCSSSILAQHTVLLASAGSRKALAMAQSLKAFGTKVLGVTHYITDPHCFSRFFDRVLVLRGVDRESASWAVHVAEIAAAQGAGLVLPVDFVDVVTFSSYAGVFEKLGTRLAAPETNARGELEGLRRVKLLSPQGYFEFLALMRNCRVVLTDSGGLQEEATHPRIRKPVLVLRSSTERPEAVLHGFARVVGTNPVVVLAELERLLGSGVRLPERSPFGDGRAAVRIVDVVASRLEL